MPEFKNAETVFWDVVRYPVIVKGEVLGVSEAGIEVAGIESFNEDGSDTGARFDRFVTTMEPGKLRRTFDVRGSLATSDSAAS